MRCQSKHQVRVKNTIIGGGRPLVCLPIVAEGREDLLKQARQFMALGPDLIEWRVDGYTNLKDPRDCIRVLTALQEILAQVPLIFTCRIEREGGLGRISDQARLSLIKEAIASGMADIVDTEICNGREFIDPVIAAAGASGTKVILSSHEFEKTPSKEEILDRLASAQAFGADIAKLAVMPGGYEDVLTLMAATLEARNSRVSIPMITMSMGEMGAVSRVAGGVFGSDVTFAMAETASAPGQIAIEELRRAMSVLYP